MAGISGRHFLQIPGPTNVPDRILRAIDNATIDHRGPEFQQLGQDVLAGMKAMRGPHPVITVEADGRRVSGELVLAGNGRFYGGSLPVFPAARLDDGLLDLCVFPRVSWGLILRYAIGYVTGRPLIPREVAWLRVPSARLTADGTVPFELEGDLGGTLPMELGLESGVLRVVAP